MQYMLHYQETEHGPYPLSKIRDMLVIGRIPGDALYWDEAASEWKSLAELLPKALTYRTPDPSRIPPPPVSARQKMEQTAHSAHEDAIPEITEKVIPEPSPANPPPSDSLSGTPKRRRYASSALRTFFLGIARIFRFR